jgi:hypothetical protein
LPAFSRFMYERFSGLLRDVRQPYFSLIGG